MLKNKVKKQEKTFSYKKITHTQPHDLLSTHEIQYELSKDDNIVTIIVNTRTSSCGSIQFSFLNKVDYHYQFDKKDSEEFLQFIFNEFEEYNHYYFIDMEDGHLEKFFDGLGFEKVWTYLNYNSENNVNMWCMNRWTEDEVYEKLDISDEYEW